VAAKELIIVGGANGAGKTTFAVEYASRRNWLYLGADAIAAELRPDAAGLVPVAAGQELTRRLTAALSGDDAIILESTLAGRTLRHVIGNARDCGFTITIVYLFLDSPDTCVERVAERVQKGGHSVPERDVRRRFLRSIRNFWRLYRPLADHWLLIYNSGNHPLDVAAGTAVDVSVRDAELYATFARWFEEEDDG
jgi:predicted ABC-type ATPase